MGLEDINTHMLLEELARRIDNGQSRPTAGSSLGEDPDYSKMSDQDAYDLAAHKGEKNIAHDELPNEP